MKLGPRSYAILWDAHAWAGAVASVLLFVVFFLGAFALFAEELSPWQERTFRAPIAADDAMALAVAQRLADAEAAERQGWFGISLPTDEEPWLRVWRPSGSSLAYSFVHPVSGERFDQRSDLGDFLNQMHFFGPLPHGQTIAGFASLVLVLLAVTGFLLQLGSVLRELIRFRPFAKQRRVFWSDAHKVVGVISLPFFLVFGLSGAVLGLEESLDPAVTAALFDGDAAAMAEVSEWPRLPEPSGVPAPAPDLRAAYESATARYPDAVHRWFFIANLGDENAIVDLPGEEPGKIAPFTNVRIDRRGEVIWTRDAGGGNLYAGPVAALYGLHFASWASLWGKAIWALLSLLGAFGILAGNLLWIERRRVKAPTRFDRFLARFTAGGCAGLAIAVAAIFAANQLLPSDMQGRVGAEKAAFLLAWAGGIAYAFAARDAAVAAKRLLLGAGYCVLAVPFLDAALTARVPFDPRTPWLFATEAGLAIFACLLLSSAAAIRRMGARRQKVSAPVTAA